MKTAIYVEDGVIQLVITPQTRFEKDAFMSFIGDKLSCEMFRGAFYDCNGGWSRWKKTYRTMGGLEDTEDHSLILRASPERTPLPNGEVS